MNVYKITFFFYEHQLKLVLMAEDRWSPLYDDVMRTGVSV